MLLQVVLLASYVLFTWAINVNICIVRQSGYAPISDEQLDLTLSNFIINHNVTANLSIVTLSILQFSSPQSTECNVFNTTCTGIVTFANCARASFVDTWAARHVIPHVIFTSKSCDTGSNHGVKMIHHYAKTNRMITDIVKHENWPEVVILNDGFVERRQHADLVNRLSDVFVASTVIGLEPSRLNDSVNESLGTIKAAPFRCVIVLAADATIFEIITQARAKEMLGQKYFWIVLSDSLTYDTLIPMLIERSNVIVLRSSYSPGSWASCDKDEPKTCILYNETQVYSMKVQDAFSILLQLTNVPHSNQLYKENVTCAISQDLVSTRQIMMDEIRKETFIGIARNYTFDADGFIDDVRYDVTSTCDTNHQWLVPVATWSQIRGLQTTGELYQNTFRSFANATLYLGSQEAIPFVVKHVDGNRTYFTGFCIDILDELALRFQFNYRIVEPPDAIWGAPVDDQGNWNGIVGMVMRKELEFGVGPFTITSIRESVIDFTKPYMEEGVGIITRRPNGESKKMFKMFTPFAPMVWGCIVIAVVVVAVLLYMVNRYSPYASHRQLKPGGPTPAPMMSFKTTAWLIYGSYMEQGGDPHPNSISGRCILGFWWLFTILMASTYTANLAAFLTVSIAEKPINSLAELAAQTEIKPLVKIGSNLYSLFKDADSGVYKNIWDNMQGFPVVKNNAAALRHVENSNMAYMTDMSQLEYIVLHNCETYSMADEIFNTAGLGFALPENAPYLEAFNYNIMKMQEAGLIDKWKQKWWPSSDKCGGSDRTSAATILGLDSLAGPFLIYASVAGLAFVFLLAELGIYTSKLNILCQKLKLIKSRGTQSSNSSSETKT